MTVCARTCTVGNGNGRSRNGETPKEKGSDCSRDLSRSPEGRSTPVDVLIGGAVKSPEEQSARERVGTKDSSRSPEGRSTAVDVLIGGAVKNPEGSCKREGGGVTRRESGSRSSHVVCKIGREPANKVGSFVMQTGEFFVRRSSKQKQCAHTVKTVTWSDKIYKFTPGRKVFK
jgi:hypothetical protein